jgi:hypothetical protein
VSQNNHVGACTGGTAEMTDNKGSQAKQKIWIMLLHHS